MIAIIMPISQNAFNAFKVIGAIKPKSISAIPNSIVLMSFIVYSSSQSKKQCTGPETETCASIYNTNITKHKYKGCSRTDL